RSTQAANAVAAGAVGVILVGTNQSPLNVGTLATPQPDVPVLGAGDMHGDELKKALCEGVNPDATPPPAACATQKTVTLRVATNAWTNLTRAVVIGTRPAVGEENKAPEDRKAPIVMVGAHIDSVLGAPGGHDDATGNGVSMEIARVVSQFPLDKELRIGGFGGEEDGLQGSRAWVNQYLANSPDRDRFIGEWQMDMVGTPHEPARLWALTPNGMSNFVVDEAYKSVARMPASKLEQAAQYGFTGLQNCRLGQSDHQAFYDIGVPSALFIWLDYRKPASGICGPTGGNYVTEPEYHTPRDGMNNVSQPRMQIMLDMIGSSFAHNAMNRVDLTARTGDGAPLADAQVTGDCGDGTRDFGKTDAAGYLEVRVPHVTCDFKVAGAAGTAVADDVAVHGDTPLSLTAAATTVGATVPATLSLTLGPAASFGAFTPGVTNTYTASMTANVISTAGDATLTASEPGHLANGAFTLPEPLGVQITPSSWDAPVSNASSTIAFSQLVKATDALRTGTYSKTLTFTLSTTSP
ncbi:MAG TPA: M28 family peptidase, partial [Solirubrobacter sp.]|nr:M28 family peptidase [Solirubrobacter sp.]